MDKPDIVGVAESRIKSALPVSIDPMTIATIISIVLQLVMNLVQNCKKPKPPGPGPAPVTSSAEIRDMCANAGPWVRFRIRHQLQKQGDLAHEHKEAIIHAALQVGAGSTDTEIDQFRNYAESAS